MGVFAFITTFMKQYIEELIGARLVYRLRKAVFSKLLYLQAGWHDEEDNKVGKLAALLSSDVAELK